MPTDLHYQKKIVKEILYTERKLTTWKDKSTKEIKHVCPHKYLYINVHSSFICNSWELETIQIAIGRWIAEYTLIYLYNEILLISKKKWTSDTCNHINESQNNHAKWKN